MATARTGLRIVVERPNEQALASLKVTSWPIWTKEPSTFAWHYDEPETCYFLEGDVTVKTADGETALKAGDLITFPKGLDCTWHVRRAVRKHYRFG